MFEKSGSKKCQIRKKKSNYENYTCKAKPTPAPIVEPSGDGSAAGSGDSSADGSGRGLVFCDF